MGRQGCIANVCVSRHHKGITLGFQILHYSFLSPEDGFSGENWVIHSLELLHPSHSKVGYSRLLRAVSRCVLNISHDEWKLHNLFDLPVSSSLSLMNPALFSPRLASLVTDNH